jgi:hypothetical protein
VAKLQQLQALLDETLQTVSSYRSDLSAVAALKDIEARVDEAFQFQVPLFLGDRAKAVKSAIAGPRDSLLELQDPLLVDDVRPTIEGAALAAKRLPTLDAIESGASKARQEANKVLDFVFTNQKPFNFAYKTEGTKFDGVLALKENALASDALRALADLYEQSPANGPVRLYGEDPAAVAKKWRTDVSQVREVLLAWADSLEKREGSTPLSKDHLPEGAARQVLHQELFRAGRQEGRAPVARQLFRAILDPFWSRL